MPARSCTLSIVNLTPKLRQETPHGDAVRPIRLDEDHDAVARFEVAEQREPDRGHAGADGDRIVAVLQLGRESSSSRVVGFESRV